MCLKRSRWWLRKGQLKPWRSRNIMHLHMAFFLASPSSPLWSFTLYPFIFPWSFPPLYLLICVCSLSLLPTTAQPEDPALYLRPETIDIHEFGHSGPSPFICTVRKETKATSHSVEPHVRVTGEWCQAVCMCVTPRDYATVFSRLPFNSGKPLAFTTFSANFKSVG